LQKENAALRRDLDEANRHVHKLDGDLIAANQRRQDAYKRIDELISHLDQLDEQLAEQSDSVEQSS
jgi:septal ring factor EnvC (AmiA/AmiB activator)